MLLSQAQKQALGLSSPRGPSAQTHKRKRRVVSPGVCFALPKGPSMSDGSYTTPTTKSNTEEELTAADLEALFKTQAEEEEARAEHIRATGGLSEYHRALLEERAISLEVAKAAGLASHVANSADYREWCKRLKMSKPPEDIEELEGAGTLPVDALFIGYQSNGYGQRVSWRLRYDHETFKSYTNEMGESGVCGRWEDVPCPRYQGKPGVPVCPYIPALIDSKVAKETFGFSDDEPLFISEAPMKCLSLYTHGYKGIGLGGVLAGCHQKRVDKRLKVTAHPEMMRVNWHGRRGYTAFDAGMTTNPTVALGVAFVWQALSALGAEVYTVTVPERPNGKTAKDRDQGPDDFIAANGRDKFQALIDAAYRTDPVERVVSLQPLTKADRTRAALALSRDLVFRACLSLLDPAGLREVASVGKGMFTQKDLKDLVSSFRASMRPTETETEKDADETTNLEHPSNAEVARVLVAKIADKYSPLLTETEPRDRVVGSFGSVWAYDGPTGVWVELNDNLLSREIQAMDGVQVKGSDRRFYIQSTRSVLEMVRARVDRPGFFTDAPTGKGFRNGFAVPFEGDIVLEAHAPGNKIRHAYEFDWVPPVDGYELPMTSEYLASALRGTEDKRAKCDMLAAHAGLCVLGKGTWINAAIVLFDNGTGGTGKSVWLELVGAMFPEGLKTAISPQQMCDGGRAEYYRDRMARADINILSEVPSSELVGGDFIKGIFDGNLTSCRAPCGKPYFCSMHLGQLYSCNGMFSVREPTQAFFDRFHLIELKNRFRRTGADKGKDYWKKIRDAELPQLIACCLVHAAQVLHEGTFPIPASCTRALEEWRQGCNAVEQFLRDETVPLTEERYEVEGTNKEALWSVFTDWTERARQSKNMGRKVFWQRLTALVGEPAKYETRNAYPFRLRRPEERDGSNQPWLDFPSNMGVDVFGDN